MSIPMLQFIVLSKHMGQLVISDNSLITGLENVPPLLLIPTCWHTLSLHAAQFLLNRLSTWHLLSAAQMKP